MKYLSKYNDFILEGYYDNKYDSSKSKNITDVVKETTLKYLKKYLCTLEDINDGFCYDFAEDVVDVIDGCKILNTNMFCSDYPNDEEALWKKEIKWSKNMLDLYGKPPINMKNWHPGDHAWVYYDKKHYDCERPDGVDEWYELPYFKKFI